MPQKSDSDAVAVGLVGLGSIGRHVARLLLDHRRGITVVAAATKEEDALGRRLSEVVGANTSGGPVVVSDLQDVLAAEPDVIVYATGSFLRDAVDDIVAAAKAGINVVSPCEELAFPLAGLQTEAERIDDAARAGGATVVGTGVNPGFVFDTMLVAASGACWDVRSVRGRRVVDVSGFGEAIHTRLGIGYTLDEFLTGHSTNAVAGHVGFPESIGMVCERLGVTLDGPVEEEFDPLIGESAAATTYGEVSAGKTEGFIQRAIGTVDGEPFIQLELILHLRPRAAGFEAVDSIDIEGLNPVHLTLDPGMDAILATSAVLVNSIPIVLSAEPGLKAVTDLPVAGAWLSQPRTTSLR